MHAQCISCCTVSTRSRSKNEQSTSVQTAKKAPNPALEHPEKYSTLMCFSCAGMGRRPWDSGSHSTNSYHRTVASVQGWHYIFVVGWGRHERKLEKAHLDALGRSAAGPSVSQQSSTFTLRVTVYGIQME